MNKAYNLKIEVELRSIFKKAKFDQLKKYLDEKAEYLGPDDKDVCFFILPDKFVKVVNNVSTKTAKIVVKLSSIAKGQNDFEEIEIAINPSDFEKATKLFEAIPFEQIEWSFQKRHNYRLGDVELALKWTQSWGYHLELEKMVENKSEVDMAIEKLNKVAKELGVKIMTEKDLKAFAEKIDNNYKKGKYEKGAISTS
jgi:predicted adenylyl cyclase CyaB